MFFFCFHIKMEKKIVKSLWTVKLSIWKSKNSEHFMWNGKAQAFHTTILYKYIWFFFRIELYSTLIKYHTHTHIQANTKKRKIVCDKSKNKYMTLYCNARFIEMKWKGKFHYFKLKLKAFDDAFQRHLMFVARDTQVQQPLKLLI